MKTTKLTTVQRASVWASTGRSHVPNEEKERTVSCGWDALVPDSERHGARAPGLHEIFGFRFGFRERVPYQNSRRLHGVPIIR
jgi:hypothetical protein